MLWGVISWGGAPPIISFRPHPSACNAVGGADIQRKEHLQKRIEEHRCANGISCVAYPALGEPSKLSRGNPGTRCFACDQRRAASKVEVASAMGEEGAERGRVNEPRRGNSITRWRSMPRLIAPVRYWSVAGGVFSPASGGCVPRAGLWGRAPRAKVVEAT